MADLRRRREVLRKARAQIRDLRLGGYDRLDTIRDRLRVAVETQIEKLTARIRKRQASEHKIVPREEWGAGAPRSTPAGMSHDNDGVFVHHSVAGSPTTVEGEKAEMRNLQRIAWSRGFNDISYSYVIFQSGRVYEGRGKGVEGAHTIGYNDTAYGVCAAGNYENATPSEAMVGAYRWLRRTYLGLGDRPCRPHSQVYSTACPGAKLRARIKDM